MNDYGTSIDWEKADSYTRAELQDMRRWFAEVKELDEGDNGLLAYFIEWLWEDTREAVE